MSSAEFSDPRLVALYDTLNPLAADSHFYIETATKLRAATIIDIGCGTGLLTCELAKRGHSMIGVDPEPAMLAVARHRPWGNEVRWIAGDATALGELNADLAIMTGHVAQVFLDNTDWQRALASIRAALQPGGHLVFESRNPAAQRWLRWTKALTQREVPDGNGGQVSVWTEVLSEEANRVRFQTHYLFDTSGEELASTGTLVFRSQQEIRRSLAEGGFSLLGIYGNWDGSPVEATSPEMIFTAVRL